MEERLTYLEELAEDIDKRLCKMEAEYEEQIETINAMSDRLTTAGDRITNVFDIISDIHTELSELQVKLQTRED